MILVVYAYKIWPKLELMWGKSVISEYSRLLIIFWFFLLSLSPFSPSKNLGRYGDVPGKEWKG